MQLELVSFPLCPFVHRVTTLLHEKGVDHSVRYIDLANKPDWFLAMSPRGRVPVLSADGRVLFESAAILEFLDETHAPRLLAEDPFDRARERAYISFAADVFMAQYRATTVKTEAELDPARAGLRKQLEAFEEAIGDRPFFSGARFGLVDTAIAPALQRMVFLESRGLTDEFEGLPRVRAWAHRLATHPAVQKGLPPDFERLYLESLRKSPAVAARLST